MDIQVIVKQEPDTSKEYGNTTQCPYQESQSTRFRSNAELNVTSQHILSSNFCVSDKYNQTPWYVKVKQETGSAKDFVHNNVHPGVAEGDINPVIQFGSYSRFPAPLGLPLESVNFPQTGNLEQSRGDIVFNSFSLDFKDNESDDLDVLDMSTNPAAFCEAVIEPQHVKKETEEEAAKIPESAGITGAPTGARRTPGSRVMPGPDLLCKDIVVLGLGPAAIAKMNDPVLNGNKPHKCPVCPARFSQSSHLNTHKRQHTGEKPFACDVCPARFNQTAHLTTHKRKHTGERPYACEVCPARFTQSDSLTKHRRQHTGEKPYPCKLCEARFTQPSSLTRHNRLHAGERPYACSLCEARFNTSSHLTRHKLQHTGEKPYGCTEPECGARFTQRIHLITHRRQHTGERPFACTRCNARFAQKSNLVTHERTHTGYKPHQCARCLKRFARLSYVKMHSQTCHSNAAALTQQASAPASTPSL